MGKTERRMFNDKEKYAILGKTGGVCAHCGIRLTAGDMTVDHVFPVNKGGLNDEYNLLPLCEECNNGKSNYVYCFSDYYRHVSADERQRFEDYSFYATMGYRKRSILGYDAILFNFVPREYHKMIAATSKRKNGRNKAKSLVEKTSVSLTLSRAYPADADEIYDVICRHNELVHRSQNNLYQSPYDILHDIHTGCVYTLEKNRKISGVFIFRDVSTVDGGIHIPQLDNLSEESGLEVRYVMTYAAINTFSYQVLDEVMQYFDMQQIQNGWLPLYYGILDSMYKDKDECIIIPYSIGHSSSTIEFMPAKHLYERESHFIRWVYHRSGYDDVPEEDIRAFASLNAGHGAGGGDGEESLFRKYPELETYFNPESYYLYDAGFGKNNGNS